MTTKSAAQKHTPLERELIRTLEKITRAYEKAPGWASPEPTSTLIAKMYMPAREMLLKVRPPEPSHD